MKSNNVEILIVEDDPNDYELTTRVVKRRGLGHTLRWFRDGVEFLDYFQFLRKDIQSATINIPRLIILDVKLPKVGGLEVLKELKEDPILTHIPVVMFTSSNQESDVRKAYQYHANSYIVKPIDYDSYSHCIEEMISYWFFVNKFA
jgi:two-component system, response regulator